MFFFGFSEAIISVKIISVTDLKYDHEVSQKTSVQKLKLL